MGEGGAPAPAAAPHTGLYPRLSDFFPQVDPTNDVPTAVKSCAMEQDPNVEKTTDV